MLFTHLARLFVLFITTFCSGEVLCQATKQPVSPLYTNVGAYSRNYVDALSFTANQASLAQIRRTTAGIYAERRFMLTETSLYTFAIALPTRKGNFGLQADYFGFKNYNESQAGLAYARSVGEKMDIGVKFNHYSFRIPSYGGASTINFEMGVIAHLSPKLHAGIEVYNPVGGKLPKLSEEKMGSVYKWGMGYEASESFFISCEIVKTENEPVNVNAGLQYVYGKKFFIRTGIATETNNFYAGAGVSWKNFRLDVSGSYHQPLGFSPGLLLLMDLNSKHD